MITLLDSCVWIGLLNKEDSTHERAIKIVTEMKEQDLEVLDHIYGETLTVLRNRISEELCNQFMKFLKVFDIKIDMIDENIFMLADNLFLKFQKLSFTDCILLAAAKTYNANLVTFDKDLENTWNLMKK